MKALIRKTSNPRYKRTKEINSLNDLAKLWKDYPFVISFCENWKYDLVIEIYDDYRE